MKVAGIADESDQLIRIVYLLSVSGWFWPSQSPELRFLSQWDFENNAHSTGIEEKGLEVASEFVLCTYLCVIEFQRKVSKKLKDWKTKSYEKLV